MTDHATLERIARQLCTDAGRDYDRKGCKRAHWRAKARRVLERPHPYPSILLTLRRLYGWSA